MVEVESAGLGVAQACGVDRRGARGEGVEHTQLRKQEVAAMMSSQQQFRVVTGIP
jgi:hypothetical protein